VGGGRHSPLGEEGAEASFQMRVDFGGDVHHWRMSSSCKLAVDKEQRLLPCCHGYRSRCGGS
jgi:hypothetical protein